MSNKSISMNEIDNAWDYYSEDEEYDYDDIEVILDREVIDRVGSQNGFSSQKSTPVVPKVNMKETPKERKFVPLKKAVTLSSIEKVVESAPSTPIVKKEEPETIKTDPIKKNSWAQVIKNDTPVTPTTPLVPLVPVVSTLSSIATESTSVNISTPTSTPEKIKVEEQDIIAILPHLSPVTIDNVSEQPYELPKRITTTELNKKLEKTKMCNNIRTTGKCDRAYCTFAHSEEELRVADCLHGNECRTKTNKFRPCRYLHPGETRDEYNFRVLGRKPIPKKVELPPPPKIDSPDVFPTFPRVVENAWKKKPVIKEEEINLVQPKVEEKTEPKTEEKVIPEKQIETSKSEAKITPIVTPTEIDPESEESKVVKITCSLEMSLRVIEVLAKAGIQNFRVTIE